MWRPAHKKIGFFAVLVVTSVACTEVSPNGCPVTDVDSMRFEAPEGYPASPGDPDSAWFGTDELWTVLPTDGTYELRKSVWWSVNFQGGELEPMPEISVTYERLNSHADPVAFAVPGTHGTTEADGEFMINGDDQQAPGCWRVTAEYRDVSLSYTYETGLG